jgi:hypothetical protein
VKKRSKQTTNQNTTATMTPTNPQWVTDSVQGLGGKITDTFKNLDPYSLVPGADPLQTQAATSAAGLTTSPNYGQATDILGRVAGAGPSTVQAGDIQGGIAGFMNPYMKDVVDTSLADYNQGAGYTRAENKLALAGDTTFGGSGGAIQTMLSNDALDRGRGTLAAGLRSGAYDRAASLAAQQANMNQQASLASGQFNEQALSRQGDAATGMANIAGAQGTDTRANIGTQADVGAILRQIEAARRGAPVTALGAESSLIGGLPLDLFKGQNATGSLSGTDVKTTSGADLGDWLKMLAAGGLAVGTGGLGLLAPGAAASTTAGMGAVVSDRRMKTDIKKVGRLDDGLAVYKYRYKAGGPQHIGVMAQEVQKVKPEAVRNYGGTLAVDYGKL